MSPAGDRPTRIRFWMAVTAGCVIVAVLCHYRPWQARGARRWDALLANRIDGMGLYVVEKSCVECHETQVASHATTSHAKTFRTTAQWELGPAMHGKTFRDAERDCEYHYRFDAQQGLSVTLPGKFGNATFPLTYALGSGAHAVSFLTLIPSRTGPTSGVEHRVSVRPGEKGVTLELTPGHQGEKPQQDVENFGRLIKGAVLTSCVECHTTQGEILGQTIDRLVPNIGCQKCHGPAREHVIAMRGQPRKKGWPNHTLRKPAAELIRECTSCHLPTERQTEIAPLANHIRSVQLQAAELVRSACFQKSENGLSCSACHDSHERISRDQAHYTQRCRECHGDKSAACPVSPAADCVSCHMAPVKGADGRERREHRIRVKK